MRDANGDGAEPGRIQRAGRGMPFTRQVLLLQVGVVLALGAVILGAGTWLLRSVLVNAYEQRALAVARTVAADSRLGDLVAAGDQPEVQQIASTVQQKTGALFVVVTDDHGIRLAHPTPDQIGRKVSTDPSEALAGREVVDIEKGTLGLSARGKVPQRDSTGRIVGEVSVGFAASDITSSLWGVLLVAAPAVLASVAIGAALSALLSRRLKRLTFGMEPAEVADLLREREAVLYGVGEGVLAVDAEGMVTMCNAEAQRLLGERVRQGMPLDRVPLPRRLRKALADGSDSSLIAVAGTRVLLATCRGVRADGADLGRVVTLRDRTDVELLTDELAAVRSMTTALRAQRHEFANRMHTVLGLLESGSGDDAAEYLRASVDSAPETRLSETTAVASTTLKAFVAAKAAQAAEVGVTLDLSPQTWVPNRLVAPVEVITVLGNLVDNAIDAAADAERTPGSVIIDLLADSRALVISVADTGDGLDPERVEPMFAEGVSTRGPDRGLGLAISRSTARSLGGDIVVTCPGGETAMTVFVATLPDVLATDSAQVGL